LPAEISEKTLAHLRKVEVRGRPLEISRYRVAKVRSQTTDTGQVSCCAAQILRPTVAPTLAADLVTALGSGRLQRAEFGNHLCFVRLRASVVVVQRFMHGREVARTSCRSNRR